MSKEIAFLIGTIWLSLALLIPCAIWFDSMVKRLQEVGLIATPEATAQFWQGYVLIALVVIASAITLMALIVFKNGDSCVVR